jgi:uracil-DNA glycosylase
MLPEERLLSRSSTSGEMTLDALHTEMRACRRCLEAGFSITPGAIFSGPASARVMIVGQAPGVTEVEAQRPFNASSGRRLFQWLAEAGWHEDDFRATQYRHHQMLPRQIPRRQGRPRSQPRRAKAVRAVPRT